MQPSSLVFVVVIGIWAAYLVQYWIRRREHMSTARSVDRFSEAMRVLDSRGLAPEADAARATRGSAVPAADSPNRRRSPLLARVRPAQAGPADGPLADSAGPAVTGPAAGTTPMAAGLDRRAAPATAALNGGEGPRGRTRPRSRLARRARAVGVLAAVAVVPLTAVLTVVGLVPWWSIVVAMGEVALCLVALRLAAVREQTARHTERSMRRSGPRAGAAAAVAVMEADARIVEPDSSDRPADVAQSGAPAPPAYRPGDPTWSPVPVPRPTYQLKDPAPEPRPEPAAPEPQEPAARQTRRRVVGG